jgi:predicted MFS family arabinose efflux permease
VEPASLSRINARLEFIRAVACIGAPVLAASLVVRQWHLAVFAMIGVCGLLIWRAAASSPEENVSPTGPQSFAQAIVEGGSFVGEQPLLRAIATCAIAWNAAFFALTATIASYAASRMSMSVTDIGWIWSTYGVGLLLGALCAPTMIQKIHTGAMMLFGPLLSCIGMSCLTMFGQSSASWAAHLAFFCLGFGPMTWLVLQTSVRQLVTPKRLLGRVGSVITTAIYGVRPIGALAASALANYAGLDAAIWLTTALFAVSALAIAVSPAARLARLPAPVAA